MTVLYRKYRPKNWNEVIGQEHIVNVLKNSIDLSKIAHAYLFCGGRGTGKTTLARILAKNIGCDDSDIVEIDAASNRKIEDVRELREGVSTLPFKSPYKAYIIDEVHMLTNEAFNALLKTLEEPPKHVVFMLATTEPEKLPETILSRCQIFELKKPNKIILQSFVDKIAKDEGYKLEDGVSDLVANIGDGSFRDTLGVLQKIFSFTKDKKIDLEEVENVVGAPKNKLVRDFIVSFVSNDSNRAIEIIYILEKSGFSISIFLDLVLERMRLALMYKVGPRVAEEFANNFSDEDREAMKSISKDVNPKILLRALEARERIKRSPMPALVLELMVAGE